MDLLEAKSRIAEALVESIFRRARCGIHPFSGEHAPLRVGREDFSPDFVVGLAANGGPARNILVEVKYRPSIEQFVSVENQRGDRSVLELARRQWPVLYFVLVTERPEPGRSCFQALPIHDLAPGGPFRTIDLDQLSELKIFPANVQDHEILARRIFALLASV
jgi:hypothetical protein